MPIAMIFAIIGGVLTIAKDVVGLDISLAQNQGGTPITAVIGAAPAQLSPVIISPAAALPFVPLAQQPTRTMAPIWSLGDPR